MAKKVSGIKRHILVDTQGLPHAIAITIADVSDRQEALKTIEQNLEGLAEVTALLVDGGIVVDPSSKLFRVCLAFRCRWPNVMRFIPLPSFRNVG
jgi:hypothetical protein